ncbi:MAG TPA: GNAT family N-acetyltransferase [Novosphingobium sp.]|nr:GNAT family N-acetyltransferase [Novosphingobium sp.]
MIETERLVLRPPSADDLPWIEAAMNTPAVIRYLGGETRSAAEVAESLSADIAAFAPGTWRHWTVWLRDEDIRVGRCGLFHVRAEAAPALLRGQSEIGWTLAEMHWGKGYASEAARAVLGYAFRQLGLTEIFSQTSDSNRASTRMMQRLGFARFPELDYVDPNYPAADNPTTVYRLTRETWAGTV